MAVKKKVVDIDTGTALKSVKSLRTELKDLKDQLVNLEQGTKEYNEVLLQAANISHDLKEMNQELAASAMDFGEIMGNTTKTIGGAVAGFLALTASMSLLGIENEDTLETIKKLQSLMALTQGIAGVEDGIKAFKRLILAITNTTAVTKLFNKTQQTTAAVENATSTATKSLQGSMVGEAAATGTATAATNMFKKALISTGIGAIVVAVGLLIANLDKLASIFSKSGKSAENAKKQLEDFNKAAASANSNTAYFEGQLKKVQLSYKPVLNSLKQHIELLKTQGASQAEIEAAEDAYHAKYMQYLDQEQKAIKLTNDKLAETINANNHLKGDLGKDVNAKNVYEIIAGYQRLIIEQEPKLEKASKKEKEAMEANAKRWQGQINLLKQYASGLERLADIDIEVANSESNTNAERIAQRKKLKEELLKFDDELLVSGLKNKEKELAQVDKAEKDKLKTLKEYRKQGALSKAEYEKRVTQITELYNAERIEIEAKWAQTESKKREDILKQQFELERKELDRQRVELNAFYKAEHQDNVDALRSREISIVEYYNKEKEIIAKKADEERALMNAQYQRETDFISEQINERYELMAQNGISDEQRAKLTQEIATMSDLLLTLLVQHNTALQDLAMETNNAIAETTRDIVDVEIENLHSLVDNVVGSMDAIAACGDGISTAWAGAFETLSNGLINLTEKIKTGGAQWQDYGLLAVAGLQAASQVMNGLASQQDAQTKEGFEKQKKYQIAAATMSMLAGVTAALSGLFTTKSGPWDIALAAIQAGIITATGIAQIVKIKQQKFDGGGSSSSASPSASAMGSVVAPVQYTQDVQGASIEGSIKDSKVYVTETDITDTQNKVDVAESEARY